MIDYLTSVGAAAASPFWLPVAAWTVVLALVAGALRLGSGLHPLIRYRIAQAGLAALPIGVLMVACLSRTAPGEPFVAGVILPAVAIGPAPTVLDEPLLNEVIAPTITGWTILGALTAAAIVAAGLSLARLAADVVALRGVMRSTRETSDELGRQELAQLKRELGIRRRVRLAVTSGDVVPMTVGLLRPTVVVPARLNGAARRLAVAHELVHVRQHDVPGKWLERLAAALFAIHPGVHWLGRRCVLLREMACDAALLSEARADRRCYADLLLQFADARGCLLAPGMADRQSHIHQRVLAMATAFPEWRPSAKWTAAVCTTVLLAASLAMATPRLADSVDLQPVHDGALAASDTIFVVVEEMPVPEGGLEGIQARVRYPDPAMRAGIEGTVFVQFVVNEDGSVSDLHCARDPGAGTCEAAIQAIRETRFRAGRQAREPVRVRFSLPIRFRLDEERPARQHDPPPPLPVPPGDLEDPAIFVVVEQMPEPVGGLEAIQERLRYPELARRAGVEGTVFVQFVVHEDGTLSEFRCTRHMGAGTCEAAIQAIRETRFRPGKQRGEAVPVRFSLPVRFTIDQPPPGEVDPDGMNPTVTTVGIDDEHVRVRGTVWRGQEALPGVSVSVVGTRIGAATDANGRYNLLIPIDLVGEVDRLSFDHPQHDAAEIGISEQLRVQHARWVAVLALEFDYVAQDDEGVTFRGRVIHRETGRPVANVHVTSVSLAAAGTDSEGRFELRLSPLPDASMFPVYAQHPDQTMFSRPLLYDLAHGDFFRPEQVRPE